MAPLGSHKDNLKEEEFLTAVLLAETFDDNFQPLIKDDPVSLISLVNTTLIDHSLDWLLRNEVNETIVYCSAHSHAERIREHCRQWTKRLGLMMTVTVIISENCTSLGDAMRDLYSKALLKKDFILLTVDVIGNLNLKQLMHKHKMTKKSYPQTAMTCFYLKNLNKNRQLDKCRKINLITDFKTGKILQYFRATKAPKFTLPIEMLKMHPKSKTWPELEDPNITICSELVPSLFADNFDYGTKDQLIQGIIEHEELLACSVHGYIIDGGFAIRMASFNAYQEISEMLVRRWNYPSIPERSSSSHRIRYVFDPFTGSYFDSSAKFNKKSIGNNVVLDAGTEINEKSRIKNTIVGKHCVIKGNTSINNSFIMSNVIISQGCILDNCYLGNNVKLLPGVHLEPGVVVNDNVILGPNLKVDRSTRLTSQPALDSFTGESKLSVLDYQVCGKEGRAYVYTNEDPEETYSNEVIVWGALEKGLNDHNSDSEDFTSLSESEEENSNAEDDDAMSDTEKAEIEFVREVKDSLLNGLKENYSTENIVLEINSSRHAYNISIDDVLSCVTKGILNVGEEFAERKLAGEELLTYVLKGIDTYADVFRVYIKKPKDQITVLKAIEEFVDENIRYLAVIQKTLYELNQELEILDDQIICFWFEKGGSTKSFSAISKIIENFVSWLNEDSDSEDED